jgi:cytochrome c-type biogenesis protein CcmF
VLSVADDLRMAPGQTADLGDVQVRFDGVAPHKGVNYQAQRGSFLVTEGSSEFRLYPEKRRYLASDNVMTEAAIRAGFTRDVYISLGEALGNGDWAVRVQYKPFVRWIWLGSLLMALGGVVAVADARYRRLRQPRRRAQPAEVPAGVMSGEGG